MSGQGAIASPNVVRCHVVTESGCDPSRGEYTLLIVGVLGELDISQPGGVDDVSLIRECVENDIDWSKILPEGTTELLLEESGEWEDVFWHKYYVLKTQSIIFDATE